MGERFGSLTHGNHVLVLVRVFTLYSTADHPMGWIPQLAHIKLEDVLLFEPIKRPVARPSLVSP